MSEQNSKRAFTLLEVMVVIVIIGILSALSFSSMNELIQTSRVKEASRTMTAFVERALVEGKMREDSISINITANRNMEARLTRTDELLFSKTLANGYSVNTSGPTQCDGGFINRVTSQMRIGTSGITGEGCFVVCNVSNYCGAAVKTNNKNTFTAYIKKRNSNNWEEL